MFIFERIFALFIFLLTTIIFMYKIKKCKVNYSKIKKYLIIYLCFLVVFGFLFKPYITADISRLETEMFRKYTNMSLELFIKDLINGLDYSKKIYFYVISKFKINGLLSAFTVLIYYSIMFYVIYDLSKCNKYDGKNISKVLFFFMITGQFMEVISGIRTMIAFGLFYLAVYREFYKNKSFFSNIIIYIIAIGFHLAVVPAIIIRFLYLIFQKNKNIFSKIFNILSLLIFILLFVKYGNSILFETISKANNYIGGNVYSYFWEYLVSFLILIYLFLKGILNIRVFKNVDYNIKSYFRFNLIFFLLVLVFSFEYTIFHRYCRLLVMLSIPLLLMINNVKQIKSDRNEKNNLIFFFLILIILILEFSRGDICGLKFFTLN